MYSNASHYFSNSQIQAIESSLVNKPQTQKKEVSARYSANESSTSAVKINEEYWINYRVGQFKAAK